MIEQFVEVYKRRVRTKDIVSVANSAFSVTM